MSAPSPVFSYLQLMRAPNLFTALSNILAAQLIITGGALQTGPLLVLMAASACLYTGGIVLNDCFDYREDLRERPQRPLPSGRIPLAVAWTLGGLLLSAGIGLAFLVGNASGLIALSIAFLVLLYDALTKHYAIGNLVMGLCRYGNWLLGLSYGIESLEPAWIALPVLVYVTSLTILSKAETTAVHRAPVLACATGMVITAAIVVGLLLSGQLPNTWALLLLIPALLLLGRRLLATYRDFTPANIQLSVKTMVLGIIPLDAILAFAGGPLWGGFAVLALMIPGTLLARVLYVT